jgi:hypothetical protein
MTHRRLALTLGQVIGWSIGLSRFASIVVLRDEQGIEAFLYVTVTPWFLVASDVQVERPVVSDVSTAIAAAIRTKIVF